MTLIREDEHSLFIYINGSIHRPVPATLAFTKKMDDGPDELVKTTWNGPVASKLGWLRVSGSKLSAGQTVKAKNINGSPYSLVDGRELWVGHGAAWHQPDGPGTKMRRKPSTSCFHNGQLYVPESIS